MAGDAKAAFKEGIRQSIKFLFKYQNGRSATETDNGDSDILPMNEITMFTSRMKLVHMTITRMYYSGQKQIGMTDQPGMMLFI